MQNWAFRHLNIRRASRLNTRRVSRLNVRCVSLLITRRVSLLITASLLLLSLTGCSLFGGAKQEEPAMIILPDDTQDTGNAGTPAEDGSIDLSAGAADPTGASLASDGANGDGSDSGEGSSDSGTGSSDSNADGTSSSEASAGGAPVLCSSLDLSTVVADGARSGVTFEAKTESIEHQTEEEDTVLSATYSVPTVEISGNPAAGAAVTSAFTDHISEFETNIEIMSAEAETLALTASEDAPFKPYEIKEKLYPTRLDEVCISIIDETYSYAGCANGSTSLAGYNFDSKTGNTLTLASIASDTAKLKSSALEAAKQACENSAAEYDLFEGYESSLSSAIRDGSWIFTRSGLVFIVPETLIAPHSSGVLYIQIPWSCIEGLKEAYSL